MSAAQKTACIQHALNMGDLFAQNAALKHGLPDKPPRPVVPVEPDGPPQPITLRIEGDPLATATANATAPSPAAASSPDAASGTPSEASRPIAAAGAGGWLKTLAPWLLAAATAGGGTGLGWWLSRPVTATTTTIVQPGDTSLLQHLQEQGLHLPPGGAP